MPIVTGRVCNKNFEDNNITCKRCIDYVRCKRKYLNNLKIPKTSIIKVKGKRPEGKKVKYSEVRNGRNPS